MQNLSKKLKKYGIPERTFFRDKSIQKTFKEDIPSERLFVYANLFDCSMEQILNYKEDHKPIKPLLNRIISSDVQKMMEKNNLKFDQ